MSSDADIDILAASVERRKHAPESTFEALMYLLRFGVYVLERPDVQRRLSQISAAQLDLACVRAARHKPEIGKVWSAEDIGRLRTLWGSL